MDYDFSGWATKNDLVCADKRVIRKNAFSGNDGKIVPLIWNHKHDAVGNVLGHAMLENRDEGVYAYCSFNDTASGRDAKEAVMHGDVDSLSIFAINIEEEGRDVVHGDIKEVSIVLAGANPGAYIESTISHGYPADFEEEDSCILYTGCGITIAHADDGKKKKKEEEEPVADEEKKSGKEMTVAEVYNSLTDIQKRMMAYVVEKLTAPEDGEDDEEDEDEEKKKEGKSMKHNVFDPDTQDSKFLSHSEIKEIFKDAQARGSLKAAIEDHLGEDSDLFISHSLDTTGMTKGEGVNTYGMRDPEMLYPDYKALQNTPEFISRNMNWVSDVLTSVHRTPFTRVKSMFADITEEEARAKGYIKGNQKKEEVFTLLKRTTDPQVIYKKQKLDRQDILSITDFNVVAWLKGEMQVMLNEEIARAILIGDGRPDMNDDKIKPDHIRPVVSDVPLFNTTVKVQTYKDATSEEIATAFIDAAIKNRKFYKGTGNPTFFTSDDYISSCLLLEDKIGNKKYKTMAELADVLRASKITEVEPFENQEIQVGEYKYPLIGTLVNLADYNVGGDLNGNEGVMEGFDIDYNAYKYLYEKFLSGALIRPFSAVTFVLDKMMDRPKTVSLASSSAVTKASKQD